MAGPLRGQVIRYRPSWHKTLYAVFVVDFVLLGWLGTQPVSPLFSRMAQMGTLLYFAFFILTPWWSRIGKCRPVPDRVTYTAH